MMIVGTNIKTGKGGDHMASLNKIMKKLQAALNSEKYDMRVKINTRQFFSEEQRRVITMYAVVMPVFSESKNRMVDREMLSTASAAEVVKYLAELLEVASNET